MEEKSTYIDAQASIDQISTSLYRQQYLIALSLISFLTIKRQDRYLKLRPRNIRVNDDPRACGTLRVGRELDDSEFEMDVKDLIKPRINLRKEKEKEALSKLQSLHARSAQDAEMPTRSRLWSYATWLTGVGPNSTDSSGHNTEGVRIEDVK
ncbi:hypothetical protein PsorP6_009747 [Peronosclerospora sorghi]|uniref:Uncharacterized protein n=1 Tax=Peronosclerospora sorghi TaxID=230839 RepID=A0ACC0VYN4_9STRA|nr:hypothetical protein PsorP6_009747 [Peronosclerospora sorghi]